MNECLSKRWSLNVYCNVCGVLGTITTTGRRLDRESQAQHWLEVQVSDGGEPLLSSTTRVLVQVTDVNDNPPIFLEQYYSVKVPAGKRYNPHFQVLNDYILIHNAFKGFVWIQCFG